ncbi:Epidermal Growth Factor-Like Protein 6 [Manis pentadactyla]|nr:Epidermal Growth Factor-Like Protein 6 [Manis pentadactyla]
MEESIDIDECASGRAVCRYNRRCVNTFGSFYCKCHVGFELKYTRGRHDCVDTNECALNTHACSLYANCLNTQGSFKCTCKQGYKGSGLQCSEPAGTPTPKVNLQQFSSKEGTSPAGNSSGGRKGREEKRKEGIEEEEEDEKARKNPMEQELGLQGDVFYEFGPVLVQRKATTPRLKHKDLSISVDCRFDYGVCAWKQDTEDDFDWNPAERAVGYYMAAPALAGRKLRVFVKNGNNVLAWEKTRSKDEKWKTGKIQLYPGITTTESIIFKAERGKGKTGEIVLDGVLLVSGLCPDGLLSVDG